MIKINATNCHEHLQTGDLVFFSGRSMFSKVTQFLSRSKWSHVGVIVESQDLFQDTNKTKIAQYEKILNEILDMQVFNIKPDKILDWSFPKPNLAFEVLEKPSDFFVLESRWPNGARILNLSKMENDYKLGKPYDGPITFRRIKESEIELDSDKVQDFSISVLSEYYGLTELLRLGFDTFLQRFFGITLKRKIDDKPPFVCGELVYQFYKYVAVSPKDKKPFLLNSPKGYLLPGNFWKDNRLGTIGHWGKD